MEQFREGLGDAWAAVAAFIPKFIAFLAILLIGYFVAKFVAGVLNRVLERVGFDRLVERGGVRRALERSKFDASDILARLVFWVIFLFVLQLAFGIFGPNPISELLTGVIAYLPRIFAAVLIIVVASAIAAGVKEIVEASIGGLSYGRSVAFGASAVILAIGIFAALNQLEIAPEIVNGLFYALLAIVVGSAIVAIGGGGIHTMRRYWERAADRFEQESGRIREEAGGSQERVRERAEARRRQAAGGEGEPGAASATSEAEPPPAGTTPTDRPTRPAR